MNQPSSDNESIDRAVFEVGDLHVDAGQQRVTRAGTEIPLPNLSFQLLLALIRAAPNVLSNDFLMARVWPGMVVSPETVAKRVNLLREALDDSAQEPRYIAGVRSRGYRLVAAVCSVSHQIPPPQTAMQSPAIELPTDEPSIRERQTDELPGRRARQRRNRLLMASVIFALIAAIVSGMWLVNKVRTGDAGIARVVPVRDTVASAAKDHTVAVLPFDNLSPDANDAYLAQGLPEVILNRLSRIDGLSVIARNSSFALPTKGIDSREIGRRLDSAYLIGGSVQREGDRLRVAVHLVDATADRLVWSARFDRGLHDIFTIEDEAAEQLAGALSPRISESEPIPLPAARTSNLEAHLAFLRGRTLLGRFTVAESEAAVPFFERAIDLDPSFSSAYASLYDARMQTAVGRQQDMALARKRYRHLIDRALELDPKSGAAYFARAMWAEQPYDVSATPTNPLIVAQERDFQQGAALDPSNGRGLLAYANFADSALERHDEASVLLKRALKIDPLSPSARFADAEHTGGESGIKVSEDKNLLVLELDPDFVPALQRGGFLRWVIDGKLAEAIQLIEHGISLDPNNPWLRHTAVQVYLDLDEVKAARDVASGTPKNPRTEGLLAMRAGDWRRAGLDAYDESTWTSDDDYCKNMLASEAIRDYALKTGDLNRAVEFIERKYHLGGDPAAHLEVCNFRPVVHLSELMAATGRAEQARSLRRAASSWLDANAARFFPAPGRLRAEILLLDGKTDAALSELANGLHSGVCENWWYTLELDPTWLPLHGDPRFQAIIADVRRHVEEQRKQLEVLRRQHTVPGRGLGR